MENEYPGSSVLVYAIESFKSVPIMKENWNLFESLVLKTAILNPLLLQQIVPLLVAYDNLVDRNKIRKVVEEIMKIHAPMGHSFEISWALWLAKTFDIEIENSIAEDIFKSNDVIPILIALDLKSKNLIESTLDLSTIIENINEDSLFEEKWLLTYESIVHDWLPPIDPNPLEINEYFKILKDYNIKFYDETIEAEPLIIKGLNVGYPEEEHIEEEYIDEENPDEFPWEGYLSYYSI